jgi:hypothetical protein
MLTWNAALLLAALFRVAPFASTCTKLQVPELYSGELTEGVLAVRLVFSSQQV